VPKNFLSPAKIQAVSPGAIARWLATPRSTTPELSMQAEPVLRNRQPGRSRDEIRIPAFFARPLGSELVAPQPPAAGRDETGESCKFGGAWEATAASSHESTCHFMRNPQFIGFGG
jgi:hypothetical protein